MLHKRAGWTYAAKAILMDGLPELDDNYDDDGPTEHIRATAQFAEDMAAWLDVFSNRMHELRQSDEYQQALADSMQPSRPGKRSRQPDGDGKSFCSERV